MSLSKVKNVELDRRRARVAEMYLSGRYQHEIGEALGIDQSVVSKDLAFVRKQWRDSAIRDFDELRQQEGERIRHLQREFLLAWERSCTPAPRPGQQPAADPAQPPPLRPGNAEFLRGALHCSDRYCKLFGLDSATKLDLGPGVTVLAGFDVALALGLKTDGATGEIAGESDGQEVRGEEQPEAMADGQNQQ